MDKQKVRTNWFLKDTEPRPGSMGKAIPGSRSSC